MISDERRWTITGLLFASGFINYLDRAILSVALPLVAVDLHLGPTAKGTLLSAFFWSYALMQLPMGLWSDRFNLRWFYAGAFAIWSLACGLTGFARTLAVLIVLRIVLGIGESVYLPGGMKIVSTLFSPKERGLASGFVNCGTRAGLALGSPLVAWLVTAFGWQRSFFIVGFSSLVWLAPWLLAFPSRSGSAASISQPALSDRIKKLDQNLLGLCLAHLGYSYYWYLLVTWLPSYLVESRHFSIQQAGTSVFIPYLIYSISEPLGGWLADRLVRLGWSESHSRKGVITVAFLTSLALLLAGRIANDTAAVWLLGAASLVGLATGNILALLQRVAPEDEVGLWTGVLNFSGNLSGIAAPLITGILLARTGSFFPSFVVAVALLIAGLPAYWLIVSDAKK
jgi:ACS family glucarate transporter-like MFS transporter